MPRQKCRTARFRKQTRHRDLPSTRTAPAATAACAGSLTRVRRTKPAARFPQKPPKQSRSLVPSRKARIARSPTRSPRAKDFATPPPAKMRSAQARIATPVKAGALLADRPSDTIPPRGHRSPTKSPASSSFAPGKIFPCAATLCFAESTRPPEDVPKSPVRGAKRVSRAESAVFINNFGIARRTSSARAARGSVLDSHHLGQDRSIHGDAAIRVVRGIVAGQRASVCGMVIRNGRAVILADYVHIEINQPFAGYAGVHRSHTVRRVAHRAGESVVGNVPPVLRPTRVGNNVVQVVALRAHGVRSQRAQVWRRERVRDRPARHARL